MKVVGTKYYTNQRVHSHAVELTEKDLYLLEKAVESILGQNTSQDEHIADIHQQLNKMQADY